MATEIILPKIYLLAQNRDVESHVRKILEAFPMQSLAFADLPTLDQSAFAHVFLIDANQFDFFNQAMINGGWETVVLPNTFLVQLTPISVAEKVLRYEQGVAFVWDAQDDGQLFKSRLESRLTLKSKILSHQIISHRLNARIGQQQANLNYQNDFLQMAVHDLRSPLAAMICYAELLMEGVLGNLQASQLEPIRTIHRNCQFLIDMVTDLLDSAKIGAGKLQLKLEKVNFIREVELAVDSLKGLADTKSIGIELQLKSVPDMYLDVQKLSRVFTNLLGNAIKFSKAKGKITIRTDQQGNALVFSIQDSGPGISQADMETIFDKFEIGGGSNIKGKGHGLGLAISKSFIELHGGKLFVESTRHKGSIFIMHLPIEKRKQMALAKFKQRILLLDFAQDFPELQTLAASEPLPHVQMDYFATSLQTWNKVGISGTDFILINENSQLENFGRDYYLLALSQLSAEARCALLIDAKMPAEDKEIRRFLGFTLIEKPCTQRELFDKLQVIVGFDRRQVS